LLPHVPKLAHMPSLNDSSITIIGIPTEAGTHFAGQRLAARALIKGAELPRKLKEQGYTVSIIESIFAPDPSLEAAATWKPNPKVDGARNEKNTLHVLRHIKAALTSKEGPIEILRCFPFFIGGDCSITPSILSAFHHVHPPETKIGLIYFDGDADLTIPSDAAAQVDGSGIFDSMVLTHLTLRDGHVPSMREFCTTDGRPLVTPNNIVIFGFDPIQPKLEHWVYMLENGFKAFTRPTVRKDPVGTAKKAVGWLEARVDVIFLHFDVDVIDSAEFPLANFPHYAGLTVEEALSAVKIFLGNEKLKGMVLTEINPNNDPDGSMVQKLVDDIVDGFARRRRLQEL
jgi:arginase